MLRRFRHPFYRLEEIKDLVRRDLYRITVSSRDGASALYLDEFDIVECVLGLTNEDWYKTMPAEKRVGLYQDVYRLTYLDHPIYLKLQVSRSSLAVVISFKRDESS